MKAVPLSRYILYLALAAGGCALDLCTKHWMFDRLGRPGISPTWWIWQDVFGFQTSLNEGALFGMGQGMVPVFVLMSLAAFLVILWFLFWKASARELSVTIALGMITAGILGNLYDRLGMPGLTWNYTTPLHQIGEPVHAVRDFILVMIGNWPWPTFNIADSLLVCGAALWVWHSFVNTPTHSDASP